MLSTTHGGVVFAGRLLEGLDYEEFNITRLMPSLTTHVCAYSFLFLFLCLSWFLMVENCNKRSLLLVSLLALHTFLGWSMPMTLMALLESALCLVILISWAIFSLPTLEQWVLSSLCSFSFCQFSLFVSVTNPFFLWIAAHYPRAWGVGMVG